MNWSTNGYQFDDSNYNYDAYEVASFESEQNAFLNVCALSNYSDSIVSTLGHMDVGSVQNVDISGMTSHSACLSSIGSTMESTVGRMGNALNVRFQKELEAGTLFIGGNIPKDFDFAAFIKDIANNNADQILNNLRGITLIEGFGDDYLSTGPRIDWKNLEASGEEYARTVEAMAKAALDKDPSEWTSDDMYALYAYQERLTSEFKLAEAAFNEVAGYDTVGLNTSEDARIAKNEIDKELKSLTKAMEAAGLRDFDNFKTYYIDNGIDMAAVQKATNAAMAKDPSEWTDYERAALAFTYYNLEDLMKSNQTNNDISGSTRRRNDSAYYEQHSALEKLLKPAGVIPYTQAEQAWIDKKNGWSTAWGQAKEYASAVLSGDKDAAKEAWDTLITGYKATTSVGEQLHYESLFHVLESGYDGALAIWAAVSSPFTSDEYTQSINSEIGVDYTGQMAAERRAQNADAYANSWIPIDSAQAAEYQARQTQLIGDSAGLAAYGLGGPWAAALTGGFIGAGETAQVEVQNVGGINNAMSFLRIAQSAGSGAYESLAVGSFANGMFGGGLVPQTSGGSSGALVPGGSSTALTVPGQAGLPGALAIPVLPGAGVQSLFALPGSTSSVPQIPESATSGLASTKPAGPVRTDAEIAESQFKSQFGLTQSSGTEEISSDSLHSNNIHMKPGEKLVYSHDAGKLYRITSTGARTEVPTYLLDPNYSTLRVTTNGSNFVDPVTGITIPINPTYTAGSLDHTLRGSVESGRGETGLHYYTKIVEYKEDGKITILSDEAVEGYDDVRSVTWAKVRPSGAVSSGKVSTTFPTTWSETDIEDCFNAFCADPNKTVVRYQGGRVNNAGNVTNTGGVMQGYYYKDNKLYVVEGQVTDGVLRSLYIYDPVLNYNTNNITTVDPITGEVTRPGQKYNYVN